MIDIFFKRKDNVLDCVKHGEIALGTRFQIGLDKNNKPLFAKIVEIIEQRKERGKYEDEKRRRNWARIKWEYEKA